MIIIIRINFNPSSRPQQQKTAPTAINMFQLPRHLCFLVTEPKSIAIKVRRTRFDIMCVCVHTLNWNSFPKYTSSSSI